MKRRLYRNLLWAIEDLNKKDVIKARKQAKKEKREKRRQERLAKRQELNGDYRDNSEYYYSVYPYGNR